jgi:C4-type Zn-finger protein
MPKDQTQITPPQDLKLDCPVCSVFFKWKGTLAKCPVCGATFMLGHKSLDILAQKEEDNRNAMTQGEE